jgi:hypothetical protein
MSQTFVSTFCGCLPPRKNPPSPIKSWLWSRGYRHFASQTVFNASRDMVPRYLSLLIVLSCLFEMTTESITASLWTGPFWFVSDDNRINQSVLVNCSFLVCFRWQPNQSERPCELVLSCLFQMTTEPMRASLWTGPFLLVSDDNRIKHSVLVNCRFNLWEKYLNKYDRTAG